MSEVNKENEKKKKQGRKSEEGIIQIIFRKNIGGNKTTFSNRQLYSSFTLPMARGSNLTSAYDNDIVKPKKTMDCGVIRNGKSYD